MGERVLTGLLVFLLIAFIPAYLLDYFVLVPAMKLGDVQGYNLCFLIFGIIRMYTPFLGVLAALAFLGYGLKKGLVRYGLRGGRVEYILLSISVPYVIYALSVLYGLILGYEIVNPITMLPGISGAEILGLDPNISLALILFSSLVSGSTINTLAALGEEMGWRGFLLGELGSKLGLYPAATIIGIVWSLWHTPLILSGYNYPHHPDLIGLGMFTILCIVWSIILSQLRVLGRSVIPSSVMHGNINAVGGIILLTFKGDELYTSPVGLLGLIASATVALILALAMKGKNYKVELYESGEEVFHDVEY